MKLLFAQLSPLALLLNPLTQFNPRPSVPVLVLLVHDWFLKIHFMVTLGIEPGRSTPILSCGKACATPILSWAPRMPALSIRWWH